MKKKELKRKVTYFMSIKFFYDYKITLLITFLWFFIYFGLSLFWGLLNNLTFLNLFMRNPNTYLVIPIAISLTHIVNYGLQNLDDFFYGDKAPRTKKLFNSETTFELLREKFYSRLDNNRVIIPIVFFSSAIAVGAPIYGVFIINEGNLYNANIFSSPILLIANLVNFGYLFLFSVGCSLGIILITLTLFTLYNIGKADEKSSIYHLKKKYQSRLKGDNVELETITFLEYQTYSKEMGVFVFKLFFKLLLIVFFVNFIGIFPVLLGITPIEYFIVSIYISLIVGFVLIFLFTLGQHSFHKILKDAKEVLLESLNKLQDKLNKSMGDELFSDGEISQDFKNGLKKLKYITKRKMEIKKLGTWPYDFLKTLKLVGIVLLSITPIMIEFLPI